LLANHAYVGGRARHTHFEFTALSCPDTISRASLKHSTIYFTNMDVISSGEEAVGRLPIALGSDVIFANPSARSVAARSVRRETVDATEVWQQISAPQSNFQQFKPKPFNWGQIIIKE